MICYMNISSSKNKSNKEISHVIIFEMFGTVIYINKYSGLRVQYTCITGYKGDNLHILL